MSNDTQTIQKLITAARGYDIGALKRLENLLDQAWLEGDSIPETAAANVEKLAWYVREERRPRHVTPKHWYPHTWELWCKMCDEFERPFTLGDEYWGIANAYTSGELESEAMKQLLSAGIVQYASDVRGVVPTERGARVMAAGVLSWYEAIGACPSCGREGDHVCLYNTTR